MHNINRTILPSSGLLSHKSMKLEFENQIAFLASGSQMFLGLTHKDDHFRSPCETSWWSAKRLPQKNESHLGSTHLLQHNIPEQCVASGGSSESMFKEELFFQ